MLLDLSGLGRSLAGGPDEKGALDGRLDFDQLTDVMQLLSLIRASIYNIPRRMLCREPGGARAATLRAYAAASRPYPIPRRRAAAHPDCHPVAVSRARARGIHQLYRVR